LQLPPYQDASMPEFHRQFAVRLREAMGRAGYPARPAVLEREFNTRYWGKPMTLHGVRRWLLGETMPSNDKIKVLAEWLGEAPQDLGFGEQDMDKVEEPRRRWGSAFGYQEREVMEAFLSLPVAQRRVVREVILTFAREAEQARMSLKQAASTSPHARAQHSTPEP
jgi:hypothetical protein